jgi:hypothetical protein
MNYGLPEQNSRLTFTHQPLKYTHHSMMSQIVSNVLLHLMTCHIFLISQLTKMAHRIRENPSGKNTDQQ